MWIGESRVYADWKSLEIIWEAFLRDPDLYLGYVANVSCVIHDTMDSNWEMSNLVAERVLKLIFTSASRSRGSTGAYGATGSTGGQAVTGSTGATGSIGVTGPVGVTGTRGDRDVEWM